MWNCREARGCPAKREAGCLCRGSGRAVEENAGTFQSHEYQALTRRWATQGSEYHAAGLGWAEILHFLKLPSGAGTVGSARLSQDMVTVWPGTPLSPVMD